MRIILKHEGKEMHVRDLPCNLKSSYPPRLSVLKKTMLLNMTVVRMVQVLFHLRWSYAPDTLPWKRAIYFNISLVRMIHLPCNFTSSYPRRSLARMSALYLNMSKIIQILEWYTCHLILYHLSSRILYFGRNQHTWTWLWLEWYASHFIFDDRIHLIL